MKTEKKHTETPWTPANRCVSDDKYNRVFDGDGNVVAEFTSIEARDHAIRAVNAHDELLAAAKAVFAEFVAPEDVMKVSTMKALRDAILKAEND